jgi:hypothetical protein
MTLARMTPVVLAGLIFVSWAGLAHTRDEVQAPRGQEIQAPRQDVQAPRSDNGQDVCSLYR